MAYASDKEPLELTALTSLASDDTIIVGDTSDVSEVAKSITFANFQAGLPYLQNVVEDTTPQAGGNFDLQTNKVVGNGGSEGLSISALGDGLLNGITVGRGPGNVATNTAFGSNALISNTTGNKNAAYGQNTLFLNTTGLENTALGNGSLFNNTGDYNVAVGSNSLNPSTTGSDNLGAGYGAGFYLSNGVTQNQTPSNSVYLGANTKALAVGGTNEVVIGDTTTGYGSNTVTLGNNSVTATYLKGDIYQDGVLFTGGSGSLDGGTSTSVYGGTTAIDGGGAS
jgi:hypothetical protein